MKKIGVLIPQSKTYPTMGKEFLNGLRLNSNEDYSFIVEGIGMGNDVEAICDRIDKLSLQEDVSALIGFVGDHELKLLYNKANSLEVPSIFVRLGAFPNLKMDDNHFAFSLSYGLCESLSAMGRWLVNDGKNQIAVSGSFNDSGYGLSFALEQTIYGVGGEFAGHYVPPINPRENEAEIAASFYEEVSYDAVIQMYNGDFAEENIEYLEQLTQTISEPMVFSAFAINHDQLQRVKTKIENLLVGAPWIPFELRKSATDFDNDYFDKHGKYPTIHSLLGIEAYKALDELIPKREELLRNGAKHETQAGQVFVNTDLIIPMNQKVWKAELDKNEWILKEQSVLTEQNILEPFEGQQSGWHNAYLCY